MIESERMWRHAPAISSHAPLANLGATHLLALFFISVFFVASDLPRSFQVDQMAIERSLHGKENAAMHPAWPQGAFESDNIMNEHPEVQDGAKQCPQFAVTAQRA